MSTIAAVLYTRERKGWVWAVAAGVAAHVAATWASSWALNVLDGAQQLPARPVDTSGQDIRVPEVVNPAQFHTPTAPTPASETVGKLEVIDKHDNVIKLPTAMGEP